MANYLYLHPWIIMTILVWTLPWKGFALWKSARKGHLGWFIVLLIINTLGILDILYIFVISSWGEKNIIEDDQNAKEQSRINSQRMIM